MTIIKANRLLLITYWNLFQEVFILKLSQSYVLLGIWEHHCEPKDFKEKFAPESEEKYCDIAYITWLHQKVQPVDLEEEIGGVHLALEAWDYFRLNYKTLFKLN